MAEDGKALTRTLSDSSRKRTSSLGSHTDTQSSRLSSPEQATTDASNSIASAWTRSGSAPPERSRIATFTNESMAAAKADYEEALAPAGKVAVDLQPPANEARQDRLPKADQQIDKLLLDGLKVAKDRLLLFRADLEMEKLFHNPARTRLRVAPPGFPPNLNSYQRLLVHRLADMWSISRELESSGASGLNQASTANVGSMISGTIVLVKTDATKSPLVRIASLAPPSTPEQELSAATHILSLVSKTSEINLEKVDSETGSIQLGQSNAATSTNDGALEPPLSATSQLSLSGPSSSSTSQSPVPASGSVRIMSRADNAAARAALNKSRSTSAGSGAQGLTFEEREAAYQQARMRIFNEAHKPNTSPVEQSSRSAAVPPSHEYQHQHPGNQPLSPQFHPQPNQIHQPQTMPQVQQIHMQPTGMSQHMNASLRPSAPVFVYQAAPPDAMYLPVQGQQQPQHFAYYPVQMQSELNLHTGPPIQITMPSPAPLNAQQPVTQLAYAAYPTQMPQQGFLPGSIPYVRPDSSHSHSSQSSISTATSQSSIRTASTSSAQRSTLSTGRGYTSPGVSLQPLRQVPTSVGPSTRQVRATPQTSFGSSSTRSNTSGRSQHSQSSSSSPSLAGDSASARVASSNTSKSESSSPGRDAGSVDKAMPEEVILPCPHPTLPSRPDWINAGASPNHPSSSVSSRSSTSSKEHASDLTEDHLSIQRDDAHTPLSSTSGKMSGRGLDDTALNFDSASDLASVVEDEHPDARSTPLPYSAPLPFDDNTEASSARSSRADKNDTASQASSTRSSRSKGANSSNHVIENPPLRYDKVKGWTMLNSSNLSQVNRSATLSGSTHNPLGHSNQYMKPPSPAPSVASSSNWSQHAFQSPHFAPPQQHMQQMPNYQQRQDGYHMQQQSQQPSHQYVMMPVQVPMTQNHNTAPQFTPQPGFAPQHQHLSVHQGPSSRVGMMPTSPQPGPQDMQAPGQYSGQPIQVYYQPVQHMQPAFQQHSPQQQQSYGNLSTQQMQNGHMPGMTPADMMANGEMLYSYDLPRPVPRSGATLFDPNASN